MFVKNGLTTEEMLSVVVASGQEVLPADLVVTLEGRKLTRDEVIARVNEELAPYRDVDTLDREVTLAQGRLDAAIARRDAIEPKAERFALAVRAVLAGALGFENRALAILGIEPKKVAPKLSLEQRNDRATKINATRARNHTMGRKQKKALKAAAEAAKNAPEPTLELKPKP